MLRPPLSAPPSIGSVRSERPIARSGGRRAAEIGPADRVVRRLRRLPRRIAARRRLAARDLKAAQAPVERRTEGENRDLTQRLYDGPAGAVLALASTVSLHEPLIGQLLRAPAASARGGRRAPGFDVSRFRDVLDVGSGAGQILGHLIREASPAARLVAFDLSGQMLRRSRKRMGGRTSRHGHAPGYVSGDMLRMPFADGSFDCVTAGWVLEHLKDPTPGLEEMARVLRPGGRLLLLCTADNVTGQWNSRTWKCRTYNPRELAAACAAAGLPWVRRHHLSPVHKALKFGGIIVECERLGDREEPTKPR